MDKYFTHKLLGSADESSATPREIKVMYLREIVENNTLDSTKTSSGRWSSENPIQLMAVSDFNPTENSIRTSIYHNKQFAEIDLSKTESFIRKFNLKDRIKLLQQLNDILKEDVIGLSKEGGKVYPILSNSLRLSVGNLLGVSTIHSEKEFTKFPENKTLSQMVEDPMEFYKWLTDNNLR